MAVRILHLAFEDPNQPGSGGGSVCTREIARRLSGRHEITAIVAGYPGVRERIEDGIHWIPIGTRTGKRLDQLTYFALAGAQVLRRPHDLIVENSSAPFGVGFSPLLTKKPVIAHVLWADTRAMRDKYHLPFDRVNRCGLQVHNTFITISEWAAASIRRARPRASITIAAPGIPDEAFAVERMRPEHLLYVGRLDMQNKGGDLLFESYARVRSALGNRTPPLIVAGDGADRAAMEAYAAGMGLSEHVRFHGRVTDAEKFRLMASAHAVLMPSRYETFGMVAAESQAAGAPVVAFNVGALSEAAGAGGACLVPPFDVAAFADAAVALLERPALADELRRIGRRWARRYNWDAVVAVHEKEYLRLAAKANRSRPAEARESR